MTTTAILIVEDERIIAKGIEKQLKSMGYSVAGLASSGEEAVEKAATLRPDLILMDISLGRGMDGVEAAGLIRRTTDVPVVYLTANSDDATLQRAKVTDPFGYVLKPYDDRDLQTAIEMGVYRHKTERRLRENEQWLAATLGSIGDGVIATDEQGRVRYMNALAERLTGWTQQEAQGRGVVEVFQIVHETTREPVVNPVLEGLDKGEPTALASDTLLIDKSGGERPIDDSAAPIRDVNGTLSGAVLIFRDITERRRLETHLRQAQKMESIGRLAGGIAHDFNNIMTIITGYSEILLDAGASDADRTSAAKNIHDAGTRAAALTKQIMAFSRKQVLLPRVLDLNTVVRDMGALLRRLIGANIELVTDPTPDLGQVRADPTQIGQVVLNLAANARDAMPQGGRLIIATANVSLDATVTHRHPDVSPGAYVLLSVTDTGSGMPEGVLDQVFEPFFTTKDVGQGTGLGLATVHGIVKQSDGHIEVASTVGEGTTVRIFLPRIEEPVAEGGGRNVTQVKGGSETILLVEDEAVVRRLTRMILVRSGYTVIEAADGMEALAVVERHTGPIHLLVTDLMMPLMSGREVAERLLPLRPGLRVLYMSGYTEDVIMQQGIESASAAFLHKPFSLTALTGKVREVLDARD